VSRYDLQEAGLVDPLGSKSPLEVSQQAQEFGDLHGDDRLPESQRVLVTEGIDHADRLLYAVRLAMTLAPPDMPIHYWTETDYLKQLGRVETRKKWSMKNGDNDLITEYEVNRMAFEEHEAVSVMVFDGLNENAQKYGWNDVPAVADLLYRRAVDPMCTTLVVPVLTSLPDYYEFARFREVVAPQYEVFYL
jgi:hypothetical protein